MHENECSWMNFTAYLHIRVSFSVNVFLCKRFLHKRSLNFVKIIIYLRENEKPVTLTLVVKVRLNLSCFSTNCSTLPCNSLESMFDTCDRAAWATSFALEEEDSGVFLEKRVWRPTSMTGHILLDVTTKNVFDLLLLKTTLNDKLVIPVNWATCSQFW